MTSHEFWSLSFTEFMLAIEGFAEFNSNGTPPPMKRDELESLMERYPD